MKSDYSAGESEKLHNAEKAADTRFFESRR
jgi:hypothetical protein